MVGCMLATLLVLGGCRNAGTEVVAAPGQEGGDPAVYAPDGWPLRIGDRVSSARWDELRDQFQVPLPPRGQSSIGPRRRPWAATHIAMRIVDGKVYDALFEYDPTKVGDFALVYRGHFRKRFAEWQRPGEADLPPEFHGKIEYYRSPDPPPALRRGEPRGVVIDPNGPPRWDEDGRLLKADPNYTPLPLTRTEEFEWPDHPRGRR